MTARRTDTPPHLPAAPEPPFMHADPIAAWLDVLIRLLRLPAHERAEIREELESHLRERTRDLMLAGSSEDHATTRAIAELGEAAQLAERFREARKRPFFRRHAMNLSILTVAGAAAVMSAVALSFATGGSGVNPPGPAGSTGLRVSPHIEADPSGEGLLTLKFSWSAADPLAEIKAPAAFAGVPLADVLARLGELSGLPAIIRWNALEELGLVRDTAVSLEVQKELPFPTIVRLINEAVDASGGSRIEYRVADGLLEIAPRNYFDRRERELISYDLGLVLERGVSSAEVVALITDLVEMENWMTHGGDIAVAADLGDRLFISAPPRMHERVSWILRQLEQPSARTRSEGGYGEQAPPAAALPASGLQLLDRGPLTGPAAASGR